MIENCPMRHENGNCIPAGGFCTANKNICEALLNAYRMGKAQLSKEGTTSDTIDRQAAIDAINSWRGRFSEEYNEAIDDCENSIKELPPAQPEVLACGNGELVATPEPQEGHWIEVAGELECSECHTVFTDLYPDYADSVACPHCGTKMTISTK